ncbi:MAG: hypothetical protein WCN98_19035, partial [Verrucomicrobiaceae bacterium]
MSGSALIVLIQFLGLAVVLGAAPSASPPSASGTKPATPAMQPPATFLDPAGTRFVTLEWQDFGKIRVTLRTVSGPGSFNRWFGSGRQTDKGIVFSQTVEDGDRGTEYL